MGFNPAVWLKNRHNDAKQLKENFDNKVSQGKEFFNNKVDQGKEFVDNKVNQSKDFFDNKVEQGKELFDNAVEQGKEFFDNTVEQSKELFDNTVEQGKELFDNAVEQGKELFDNAVEQGKEFCDNPAGKSKEFLDHTLIFVGNNWGESIKNGGAVFGGIIKSTGDAFENVTKTRGAIVGNIVESNGNFVGELMKTGGDFVDNLTEHAGPVHKVMGDAFGFISNVVGDNIITGANVAGDNIRSHANFAGETIGQTIKDYGDAAGGIYRNIGESIIRSDSTRVTNVDPKVREGEEKKLKEQVELIEQGLLSKSEATKEAAENLKHDLTAQQMALLSEAIYEDSSHPPPGWKDISDDAEALKAYGLTPEDLSMKSNAFRARIYAPDAEVFGDTMKPALVFKGSTPPSELPKDLSDWGNNFLQVLGGYSDYYERAVQLGNKIKDSGKAEEIHIAGHSLGGGMASATSSASGSDAYTFNSAGLHSNTVTRYGGEEQNSKISAYRIDGEILTTLQEDWVPPLPDAKASSIETLSELKGTDSHSMDAVNYRMQERVNQSEKELREHLFEFYKK